jgi:hypothetical protein
MGVAEDCFRGVVEGVGAAAANDGDSRDLAVTRDRETHEDSAFLSAAAGFVGVGAMSQEPSAESASPGWARLGRCRGGGSWGRAGWGGVCLRGYGWRGRGGVLSGSRRSVGFRRVFWTRSG